MSISTKQIGDGKLPNKFWVSISEDYLYFDEVERIWTWISDVVKSFVPKGMTIRVFNSYRAAVEYVEDHLCIGCDYEFVITMNCITIEDRISGEIYRNVYQLDPRNVRNVSDDIHEDYFFTAKNDPDFK